MSELDRVYAAVDLGEGSARVLGFAAALARASGAELIAFHVISPGEQEDRAETPGDSRFVDVMVTEVEGTLRDLVAASVTDELAFRCIARIGYPADEIVKVGMETDSLVVVGLKRRSRVGKFLLGSDLQQILLSATHPVVTVPIGPEVA